MAKRKIIRATDVDTSEGLSKVLQGVEDRLSELESRPPTIKTVYEVIVPSQEEPKKKGKSK